MVVPQTLHEIPADKFDVIELRKIENMRFRQNGRGNIQLVANIRQIIEKVGIRKFFGVLVYKLFTDFSVRHQFSPNSHIRIIHETEKKVNRFKGKNAHFSFFHKAYSQKKPHTIKQVRVRRKKSPRLP